jgi:hypothetical protein
MAVGATYGGGLYFRDSAGGLNYYIYNYGSSGSNRLSIGNGADAINITTSGNVGIGTTSPSYKLDVNGTLNASATSTFAGRVGIGTTAPQELLDVLKTGSDARILLRASVAGSYFRADSPTPYYGLELATNGTTNWFMGDYGRGVLGFAHGSYSTVPSMVLDSSGNVGIGTTGPANKLDVNGVIASGYTAGGGELRSYWDNGAVNPTYYVGLTNNNSLAKIGLYTGNSGKFFLSYDTSNGNTELNNIFAGAI